MFVESDGDHVWWWWQCLVVMTMLGGDGCTHPLISQRSFSKPWRLKTLTKIPTLDSKWFSISLFSTKEISCWIPCEWIGRWRTPWDRRSGQLGEQKCPSGVGGTFRSSNCLKRLKFELNFLVLSELHIWLYSYLCKLYNYICKYMALLSFMNVSSYYSYRERRRTHHQFWGSR